MTATAAAILVGVMILGGCAEGKGGIKGGKPIKFTSAIDANGEPRNIDAALIGLDLPKLRPYGTSKDRKSNKITRQPGLMKQIFEYTEKFVQISYNKECYATEETEFFRTFEETVNGLDYFSAKNSGVQLGYETELTRQADFNKGVVEGNVGTTMTIPPAFTASESTETNMKELKKDTEEDSLSKTTSYAKCVKYTSTLSVNHLTKFQPSFIEALKEVEKDDDATKLLAEYGTHFATVVDMGASLTIEKTFKLELSALYDEEDTKNCKESSANFYGQLWKDTKTCKNLWTKMNSEDEMKKEEMTVWSIGCNAEDDLSTWMENQPTDATPPAPIERRGFAPIVNLMKWRGITDKLEDVAKVKAAIWRAYDNYCTVNRKNEDGSSGAHCDLGCPDAVVFTNEVGIKTPLERETVTDGTYNGRILYSSKGGNFLFYLRGQWHFGPKVGDTKAADYESMLCPQIGAKMLKPDYVKTSNGKDYIEILPKADWTECGRRCNHQVVGCEHWEFNQYTRECSYVKKFDGFEEDVNSKNAVAAGHRNCPWKNSLTLFNMCPDNNEVTYMWRAKKDTHNTFYNPEVGLGAPVDCKWENNGDFGKYGSCAPLGITYPKCYEVRKKTKEFKRRNGGKECEGDEFDKRECHDNKCKQHTSRGCQGKVLRIACDDGEAIAIDSAFYGVIKGSESAKFCENEYNQNSRRQQRCNDNTDANKFAKEFVQYQWESADAKHVYGAGCEGATTCTFKVDNAMNRNHRDPCSGSHKHTEIKYRCTRPGTRLSKTVGQYEDVEGVECREGQTISVHHPITYKSVNCPDNPLEQGKAYDIVNKECEGQQRCKFKPNYLPDVCNKRVKKLSFGYSCGTSAVKCQGGTVNIACPTSTTIVIKSAFYGRDSRSLCRWGSTKNTNCGTSPQQRQNAMAKATDKCDGKQQCEIKAWHSHTDFTDYCYDTRKYLEVEYGCEIGYREVNGAKKETCDDGQICDMIKCDGGEKIEIHWPVEYGSKSCPNYPLPRKDAHRGVAELCEGKTSCLFTVGPQGDPDPEADPSTELPNYPPSSITYFNDVCTNEFKQLTVYYKCV